ncbi:hypothetical protein GCM10007863_40090 [Dyella mobilis]|nr:hypothetical protein GCM10007863_40090 [Dyella mobilis]
MARRLGAEGLAAVVQFVASPVLCHDPRQLPSITWQDVAPPTDAAELFDGLGIAHEAGLCLCAGKVGNGEKVYQKIICVRAPR